MVKFVKVTLKKFKPDIIDGQLVGSDLDAMIHRQEDIVNQWVLQGYDILHVIGIEDLRGYHLLFVLFKNSAP